MKWDVIRKRTRNRLKDVTHCKQCGDEIEVSAEWTEDGVVEDPFCDHCVDFTGVWRSSKHRLSRRVRETRERQRTSDSV